MKITSINVAGSTNIIKWAINNQADILNDIPLQSMINDEMFFQVTIEDVHFLEMFRLSQVYRDKLRIILDKSTEIPSQTEIETYFPGEITMKDESAKFAELAIYAIDGFRNIAVMMNSDDDIIRPESASLFFPMITRRFNIQIPVSFMDILSMLTEDQVTTLFSHEFPVNINQVLIDNPSSNVPNAIQLGMIKSTSMIRYNKHYEDLMTATKYYVLNNVETKELYKFRPICFYKYDPVSRSEVRCSMFKPTKADMTQIMRRLRMLKTGLKVDFAVELPIYYMARILNYLGPEALKVSYESSINDIYNRKLSFNDFISQEFNDDEEEAMTKYNNAISAYRIKISEVDNNAHDTIDVITGTDNDADLTATYALLPPIYTTRAVFTIDMDYTDAYINQYDATIKDMFQQMLDQATLIDDEIKSTK